MNPRFKTLLIGLLLFSPVLACQYNVRDIGFVDLNQSTYRLYVFLAEDNAEIRSQCQSLLSDTLDETNMIAEFVSPGSQIQTIATPEKLPAAVLVSPTGRPLILPLDSPDKTLTQTLADLATQLVRSQVKTDILKQLSKHFAVVLLIESENAQKNQQAALSIEVSLLHIEQQMIFMPKKIESPPVMVKLTAYEVEQNNLLLWELDITQHNMPTAAILYGRLRTMGPVLVGDDIAEDTLKGYLGVIGADCECDLDRRLLHSPMLAHHWPRSMYEAMTEALGFDPEHPEVKMEVSQIIMAHGPAATGDLQTPDVTFGYQEFVIEDWPLPQSDSNETNQDSKVAVVKEELPQKRPESGAESITPSTQWPLYSLCAMAAVIILTGIIIVQKRRQ